MKKIAFGLALILLFLIFMFAGLGPVNLTSGDPSGGSSPILAMPVEYVNYTIMPINGTLWAKIDGDYPIYWLNEPPSQFNGELPMVYPMPPNSTNIHVFLGDKELSWSNYTQAYPNALQHTAIGNWWMIYFVVGPISNYFELKIHYEHPVQIINGSYVFLYNLNIASYLTPQNSNSTCYYTINMDTNITNLHAYTTGTGSQWNPINYTIVNNGTSHVVSIQEYSDYYKPLPGDLAIVFSEANPQVPEFSLGVLPTLMLTVIAVSFHYVSKVLKKKVKVNKQVSNRSC